MSLPRSVELFDSRAELLNHCSKLEKLCTGAIWSEGPVWMHEDESILWSDIPNNRMLRWSRRDGMSIWREKVDFTNGHTRQQDGSLLHCSHGQRAIIRTRFVGKDGKLDLSSGQDEVLVDRYQGRRLNSPNDVIVKSDGTIWFTDPQYGILSDREGHKAESELGKNFVFRFDPKTKSLTIASDFVDEPNGLAFSPDESMLYVSDTSAATQGFEKGNHHIVCFDVIEGRSLLNPKVFALVAPGLADGFRITKNGWLYTSSENSVQVFHPDGTLLAKIPVPEKVGNLTFGGKHGNELYICASTSLYRLDLPEELVI
jgi:gluconolactonase